MRPVASAVVFGGNGFLGTWLLRELASAGVRTTVVDRSEAPPGSVHASVAGELESLDLVQVLADAHADAVFHLATPAFVPPSLDDPIGDLLGSAGTTLRVLEAVRRTERPPVVTLLSSAAVYGTAQTTPMDESHPREPTSPYGVAKLAAEEYVRLYTRQYGIESVIVRPFSLYGPGQRKLVVFDLLCRLLKGEDPLAVGGRADVTRDLLYAGDAARGIRLLTERALGQGEAYNLGAGTAVSLGDLVDALVAASGTAATVNFSGQVRKGDPLRWEADTSSADALGASATTPLSDGLAATVAWIRENWAALTGG